MDEPIQRISLWVLEGGISGETESLIVVGGFSASSLVSFSTKDSLMDETSAATVLIFEFRLVFRSSSMFMISTTLYSV